MVVLGLVVADFNRHITEQMEAAATEAANNADVAIRETTHVPGAYDAPLAADRLANLELTFDLDTPVFGDDEDAKEIVSRIAEDVEGLRAVDAGSLEAAPAVESLTPLIVTLGMQGVGHDLGVKFQ